MSTEKNSSEIDINELEDVVVKEIDSSLGFNDVEDSRKISARRIVKYVLENNLTTETDMVSLLGEVRHRLNLVELERALVRSSIVNESKLAKLKGEISGYPYLENTLVEVDAEIIDEMTSRNLGAVAIKNPELEQGFTIAIVEDVPANVESLEKILGKFNLTSCTVSQFTELHKVAYKGANRSIKSVLPDIYTIFDEAIRKRASDIHLSVGLSPSIRVDGKLTELNYEEIDRSWMRSEVVRIAGPARLLKLEKSHDVDMAFPYGQARFRVNFGNSKAGYTMAARKIPTKVPNMDELGLPKAIQNFANLDKGLVLVTGATGSGKSTTLAALLGHIASNQTRHIITLEDPIEFILPKGEGVVHQRELNSSFTGFPEGLRQALRQDPDVILVGEMRDLATIATAVTAAETGHLVFGTLHTFDASSTVSRIVSMYPTEEQEQIRATLSYTLKGIVSQTLLKQASGSGRVAAFEVMVTTPAIANNLRRVDGAVQLKSSLETGMKDGMQTMDMALADLVKKRVVTEEAALEKAVNPDDFRKRLAQ